MNSWPDGGMTPFRSEKNTNWEGAFRVPEMIRWPGRIPAGVVSNEIVQHHDWLPTFLAAAGEPDIVEKLKAGHTTGDTTFKVHIDGYNLLPYLTGEATSSPRKGFVYFSDDGDLLALRFDNWKIVFMEQRVAGTLQIWAEPFVPLRVPKLFNLRTDPFERADVTSNTYYDWFLDNAYLVARRDAPSSAQFLETFEEFPPRQKAASFTIDQAVEKLEAVADGGALTWPSPALLERHADPAGDQSSSSSGSPEGAVLVPAGARRRLRQRRHAVVREADATELGFMLERLARWPRRTRRCGERQPWKAAHEGDSPGWAARSRSTTRATTAT